MKPGDKERLVKARPALVRSLDITTVLPLIKKPGMFSDDDERKILSEPRRRERVVQFLDMMEKKTTDTYQAFCDILEELYPHLFLTLTDWDKDDQDDSDALNRDKVTDEWGPLHRSRDYLIGEIDAAKIASFMRQRDVLTPEQERAILNDDDEERRTETFLDILEMKPPKAFEDFLEIVGEIYPHVYLELTGSGGVDDL